jgi:hypothetical protein
MHLKHLTLSFLLVSFSYISKAQGNFKLNLRIAAKNAFVSSIHFNDNNTTIYINSEGNISLVYDKKLNDSDDNIDEDSRNYAFYNNVPSSIEYYGNNDWDELKGKIKLIGNMPVTYYDRFDWDELRGKVKSIGNVKFTYYDRFNWDELKGKLKSIDNINITYYDRFDQDELQGKMKVIGNTAISYYDRYGPKKQLGWIKDVNGTTPGLNVIWRKRRNFF